MAEPYDADGFPENLHTGEFGPLPGVLPQGGVRGGDLTGGGEQQRNRMLTGRMDVRGGGVGDHDAAFGGGGNVHIIQPHPGAAHNFQVGGGFENFPVDCGCGADEEGVGVFDGVDEFGPVGAVNPPYFYLVP